MSVQSELLAEIADFCDRAGIAVTTFGNLALKDSRFVDRLRQGKVTILTMDKAKEYMQQNKAA